MKLVYKFDISFDKQLYGLCEISKNLYNQALYLVKHELKTSGEWLGYSQLDKLMPTVTTLEGEINYRLLKAQVSQQCLRVLDKDIKSYVSSIKSYAKNKDKFNGKPRFPKFKQGVNQLIYTNQCCSIKNGCIYLSKSLKIRIPQYEEYAQRIANFQQVRINPRLDKSFSVEIVYNYEMALNSELDYGLYASVDLGVGNLATLVLPNAEPILYNGKPVKAKNQFFNKTISRLKSKIDDEHKTSKQIKSLYVKRDRQLTDIYHKLSRRIVNVLVKNKIGNIVVGYNKGWKDSINIGKRNNQTFVYISYDKLLRFIRYKCEMCGIKCVINEESYTSKCDGLALEKICKHEKYAGKRVKRGLFRSSVGKVVNADVNGALNIMRKVVGDSVLVRRIIDSGRLFRPTRVNIF